MSSVLMVSCEMGTLYGSSLSVVDFTSASVMMPALATLAVSLLAMCLLLLLRLRFAVEKTYEFFPLSN